MAVPSAPTDVAATENIHDKVTVTWTKSAGATGYEVYADGVGVSGRLGDVSTFDHIIGAVPSGGTKSTVGNNTLHSYTTNGTYYFWSPVAGNIQVECWGAGGSGGGGTSNDGGAGGGGGAYAKSTSVAISAGVVYAVVVGKGGASGNAHNGEDSTFNVNVVVADGGLGANGRATIGTGGTTGNSIGNTKYAGGSGGIGNNTGDVGAGGGGAGGPDGAGGTADNCPTYVSTDGGAGDNGSGGAGGANGSGGNGGAGGSNVKGGGGGGGGGNGYSGGNGGAPGGGGGGGEIAGGAGADGQVVITYVTANFVGTTPTAPSITAGATVASDGTVPAHVALSLSGTTLNSGTVYAYTVKAINADGISNASSADNGARVSSLNYQWKKSTGDADSGYNNISGATSSTYDDTEAPAPVINGGTADASDGTDPDKVVLSVSGHSVSGEGRYYYCEMTAQSCTMVTSTANRGYRGGNTLSYQWMRSAAESDADYSNIAGATTNPYNDTGAP